MDLKVPIVLADEMSEDIVKSTAFLNLSSGEIQGVEYEDYDLATMGLPFESDDYEFTCGTLSNAGKDVEFKVEVNKFTGLYSVSASELLEIKIRAAALFAGVSGQDMLASTQRQAAPAARPPGGGSGPRRRR